MKLIETIKNIWRVEDLRTRIGFTLLFVAIYRFGSFVVLPGIDPAALQQLQAQTSDGLMALLKIQHQAQKFTSQDILMLMKTAI